MSELLEGKVMISSYDSSEVKDETFLKKGIENITSSDLYKSCAKGTNCNINQQNLWTNFSLDLQLLHDWPKYPADFLLSKKKR